LTYHIGFVNVPGMPVNKGAHDFAHGEWEKRNGPHQCHLSRTGRPVGNCQMAMSFSILRGQNGIYGTNGIATTEIAGRSNPPDDEIGFVGGILSCWGFKMIGNQADGSHVNKQKRGTSNVPRFALRPGLMRALC